MRINVVASGFFSKLFIFVLSVLNFVFLTIPLSTTSLNFYITIGTIFNLPTSKSSTFVLSYSN